MDFHLNLLVVSLESWWLFLALLLLLLLLLLHLLLHVLVDVSLNAKHSIQ